MMTSTIADQMYRIASASPGISYTTTQLQQMTTAAADLAAVMGPTANPEPQRSHGLGRSRR